MRLRREGMRGLDDLLVCESVSDVNCFFMSVFERKQ